MKFSEIDFPTVKEYLTFPTDDDEAEVSIYIAAAQSYVRTYTALTDDDLDASDYFVMPTLMLISSFYENRSVEMTGRLSDVYNSLLTLGMVHSL